MLIPRSHRRLDPVPVQRPRLLQPAELLQCLPPMEIRVAVVRIDRDQFAEFADRALQISAIPILHCQSIARETVVRILRHHAFQNVEPGAFHACATIPPKWPVPSSTRSKCAAWPPASCRSATYGQ